MATTLQTILDEITEIKDNGNNTAAELRKVLTDIVDYSNNGFEISNEVVVETPTQMYQYSFKGTKKQCCNLYLLLFNKTEPNTTTGNQPEAGMFSFEIQQTEYETLTDFIPDIDENGVPLVYNLATLRIDIKAYTLIVLRKIRRENVLKYYVLINTDLSPRDAVITTIPLNYKKTVFPAASKKAEASFKKSFEAMLKTTNLK